MLWILIPGVCAVLALLGLALCRAAGRSDAADSTRTAIGSLADGPLEAIDLPAEAPAGQVPFDRHYSAYRAAG
jgi:hypothetical protein